MTHPIYQSKKFANLFGPNPFIPENYLKEQMGVKVLKHVIPVGRRPNGAELTIDIPARLAKIISVIAPRGSGKSFLITAILIRAFLNGFKIIIAYDWKNEYYKKMLWNASVWGEDVQQQISSSFIKLVPTFLAKYSWGANMQKFQFEMNDLCENDLLTAFGVDLFENSAQATMLRMVRAKIPTLTVEKFEKMLQVQEIFRATTMGYVMDSTRKSMAGKFWNLMKYNVFGQKNKINMKELITNNQILDFVYEGKDDSTENYAITHLAIVERMIRSTLAKNYQDTIVVYDEGRNAIPKNRETSTKREVKESIQGAREFGESMIFGIQDLKEIAEIVLGQSEYVFITPETRRTDVEKVLKDMIISPEVEYRVLDWALPMAKNLKGKNWPWILVDRKSNWPKVFFPYVNTD